MQLYEDNVQDLYGNARPGVSVLVEYEGSPATIYSDNGVTPKANPLTTGAGGSFSFYAANGVYTLTAGEISETVTLFDSTELATSGGAALVGSAAWYAGAVVGFDASDVPTGATVIFSGRGAANDGGGGIFTYDAASAQTADDVLVFAPTGGGRLFRNGWTVFGFNGPINVCWAGALGDGATGNHAAVVSALAVSAGRKLRFPAGQYMIPFSSTDAFSTPASITLEGDGKGITTLTFVPSSSTYRNLFTVGNPGLTLKDMTVNVQAQSGQVLAFFNVADHKLTIDNCDLDGSVTDDGAATSHTAYCFSHPETGQQDDLSVIGSALHNFTRGLLKTNTATSEQRRLTFIGNDLYDCYVTPLTFNSPLGVMDTITIQANRFFYTGDIDQTVLGVTTAHVALASTTNTDISGNKFSGANTQAIHIEEACYGTGVRGNEFDIDATGIAVLDNNIAGPAAMPKWLSISGNTLRKSGALKEAGKHAIALLFDATAEVPAKAVSVDGNVIYGFDTGIYTDSEVADGVSITDNVVDGCANGLNISSQCPQIKGNTTRGCDVDILSQVSGWVEDHSFVDSTVPVDFTSRPVTLVDPTFSFSAYTCAAGVTTYKPLITLAANDRAYGWLTYNVWTDTANDHAAESFELTWDGTTLTATQKYSRQPGAISAAPSRTGTTLDVGVFNAAQHTARLVAKVHGSILVAA
jgi:hypothetical protein